MHFFFTIYLKYNQPDINLPIVPAPSTKAQTMLHFAIHTSALQSLPEPLNYPILWEI